MPQTAGRLGLLGLAIAFAVAEAVRPTRIVTPKRFVANSLILRSQHAVGGTDDTLDAELLDDLPRIHPNALGALAVQREALGSILLSGRVADPYTRAPGVAVFAIVDGRRLADACTRFGVRTPIVGADGTNFSDFQIVVPAGVKADVTRIAVGLVALDRRGYFLLGPDAADAVPMPPSRDDGIRRDCSTVFRAL